jgi:predicted dehydrogenase
LKESKEILSIANKYDKKIKTGFNHRFHPAMIKAKEMIDNKSIGKLINIRARYGHGGRFGMEKEWRCSKNLSGGGELIDQGVHIIDLCRWFTSKEVLQVYGRTFNSFWETDVEDNAFFNLEFDDDIYAQCHASWTNWKNIFSFEIFGNKGYIKIEGLGGNYGKESFEVAHRNNKSSIPTINNFQYDDGDLSWTLEWKDFKKAIKNNNQASGSGEDGYAANLIIDAIYESNKLNKPININ